jgi:hypothetical protein
LTVLGAAGEALGYGRHLKSNTTKRRTHSLFRQGAMLYDLIPTMPEARLRPLLQRFEQCSATPPSSQASTESSKNEGILELSAPVRPSFTIDFFTSRMQCIHVN